MILSLLVKLAYFALNDIINLNLQNWGYSEFLISFGGGFVRRGVIGEFLMWITSTTGILPQYIIIPICLLAYFFVLYFFLIKFNSKGYNWWILLSPILCGFTFYIIRKDYLLYCILISMLYLVRESQPKLWKCIFAVVLGIFALFIHEAFIFWGIPIFILILLTQKEKIKTNFLMCGVLLFIFGLLCVFKGDINIANSINSSWNNILPNNPLSFTKHNSIGALSWSTIDAIKHHVPLNIGSSYTCFGLIYWPLCYCVVYYFISFFFIAFQPKNASFDKIAQSQLSYLFLTISICLLPMFTILSCDYGRIFQYTAISSFAAFFILDNSVKERIIPKSVQSKIFGLNSYLSNIFVPTKGLLVTLMLVIGISPFYFNIYAGMIQSPIGTLGTAFTRVLLYLYHNFI